MSLFSAEFVPVRATPSSQKQIVHCAHCGDLVPTPRVEEGAESWCCSGCEGAAAWIRENNLGAYYDRRTELPARPEIDPSLGRFDDPAFVGRYVKAGEDGISELRLQIDGLHCAACVWLNEKALQRVEGVCDAHVSYGTRQAKIRFDEKRTTPGQIARVIATLGYTPLTVAEKSPDASMDLLTRLAVAAFCATQVMMVQLAIYFGAWSGDMLVRYEAAFAFFSLVVACPAALYSAVPFYRAAYRGLKHRQVSMDLPVAFAIVVMFAHGIIVTFGGGESFLDSMTMLIAFLLAGRFVEARGRKRSAEAAESVLALAPQWATRVVGDSVEIVPADELHRGDTIVVGRGESVPADGVVIAGEAELDVSHVTGESLPIICPVGATVQSASLITAGRLHIRVEAVGSASTAGRIAELVRTALEGQSEVLRLADRIAPWFVSIVGLFAIAAFVAWYFVAGLNTALSVSVALLVVACPCALSLAAPAAQIAGVGASARRGAFVRDMSVFEAASAVDVIGVDKTGTVTSGQLNVGTDDNDLLALAASLELGSSHPIGRAIVAEALRRSLAIAEAESVEEVVGVGIRGRVGGDDVEVVASGTGDVSVRRNGVELGEIKLRAIVRQDAALSLARAGVPVHLLSGDADEPVHAAADAIGAHSWQAHMSPEQKLEWVKDQQRKGHTVLFAGDGVNDAAAIAAADVGVAMHGGAESGVRASDVIVMSESLGPIASVILVARETERALRFNARAAVVYNLAAVVVAAAGLISPPVAAILMPVSSAFVLGNARSIDRRVRQKERS